MISVAGLEDSELVGESLSGNRDAFGRIVSRYQSLICSLAYSATGSLGQSEDLAQETFIVAWKRLSHLRERDKLRAWLCGIARNRINNFLRSEGREPVHAAAALEDVAESHSPEPLPVEHVITQEEQALLWRSLERIPEIYRESLVLFYREQQSIETVAAELELSEDAVKQRLSRGRKLLQEQVLAFVEGALAKTTPGKTFTVAVVAALPLTVVSAKAATIGATVAKGGAAAKGALTFGVFGSFFALLGGAYLTLMAKIDDTKSPRERRFVSQVIGLRLLALLFLILVFLGLSRLDVSDEVLAGSYSRAAFLFLLAVLGVSLPYVNDRRRQIQIEDGTMVEAEWNQPRWQTETAAGSGSAWKSRLKPARFMALGFACCLVIAGSIIKSHSVKEMAIPLSLIGACLVLSLGGWWQRPRFQAPQLGWQIAGALVMATVTLIGGNHNLLHPSPLLFRPVADVQSLPTTLFVFNAVIVLAYAIFIALIIRFYKKPGLAVSMK
jgi:RNA polymerase sigma factor (sigma-70 family)